MKPRTQRLGLALLPDGKHNAVVGRVSSNIVAGPQHTAAPLSHDDVARVQPRQLGHCEVIGFCRCPTRSVKSAVNLLVTGDESFSQSEMPRGGNGGGEAGGVKLGKGGKGAG